MLQSSQADRFRKYKASNLTSFAKIYLKLKRLHGDLLLIYEFCTILSLDQRQPLFYNSNRLLFSLINSQKRHFTCNLASNSRASLLVRVGNRFFVRLASASAGRRRAPTKKSAFPLWAIHCARGWERVPQKYIKYLVGFLMF